MADSWTIQRVLEWAAGDLRERGFESARLDAELMLAMVLECDRIKLIIDSKRPLAGDELACYKLLHKRRRNGEPVAYLRGTREFFSREFHVDKRVMVPRPETELLVEVGLRRTRSLDLSARVLDICTGSGCVAITLKKERPTTRVFASDVSPEALSLARHNALRLGARVAFAEGSVFSSPLAQAALGQIDLVTANPPYISAADAAELPLDVSAFEPELALYSGDDGLDLTRSIVRQAPEVLAPGGVLALEVAHDAAERVAALMTAAGLMAIEVDRDFARIERVVSGALPH